MHQNKSNSKINQEDFEKLAPNISDLWETKDSHTMKSLLVHSKEISYSYLSRIHKEHIRDLSEWWIRKLKSLIKDKDEYLLNSKLFKSFDWNNIKKAMKTYESYIADQKSQDTIKMADIKLENDMKFHQSKNLIANIYYGSCPLILDKMIKNKEETSKIIKWMKKRFLTIQESLKKPILNRRSHGQIIENLMSFIENEMEDSDRNREKGIIIGEQKDVFLMKETLKYYPFESLMKLNSTRGRLFVLLNLDKFVQLPNFVNQIQYENVFGFVWDSEISLNSK